MAPTRVSKALSRIASESPSISSAIGPIAQALLLFLTLPFFWMIRENISFDWFTSLSIAFLFGSNAEGICDQL